MTDPAPLLPLIPASKVAEKFGVAPLTLTRWARDGKLDFPPAVVIRGRFYWRDVGAIDRWFAAQVAEKSVA